jgi:hypothetical protein
MPAATKWQFVVKYLQSAASGSVQGRSCVPFQLPNPGRLSVSLDSQIEFLGSFDLERVPDFDGSHQTGMGPFLNLFQALQHPPQQLPASSCLKPMLPLLIQVWQLLNRQFVLGFRQVPLAHERGPTTKSPHSN